MSYILDALKKSAEQRDLGQVPGIGTDHSPGHARYPHPHQGWGILLGAAAGAMLAGGALLLVWRPWGAPEPAAAPVVPATAARPDPAPPGATQTPVARPPAAAASATTVTAVTAPVEPPAASAAAAPTATLPIQPPEPVQPVAAQLGDPLGGEAFTDVPARQELPEGVRSALPELRLNVHVYSIRATARFVFINDTMYHEGQTTREGARVEAITPEGVVLSYAGTRFRAQL